MPAAADKSPTKEGSEPIPSGCKLAPHFNSRGVMAVGVGDLNHTKTMSEMMTTLLYSKARRTTLLQPLEI